MAKKSKKTQIRPIIQEKPAVPSEAVKKTKIRIIGIGGGAGAIVSEIASRVSKATFVAANTDAKALKTTSRKVIRFPFGQGLTRGLGTGMNAELGSEAALAEKDRIKKLLEGQDLCILVASLGGGTGSGAAPIFAKISKKLGNLTYGIFTLPFKFEGEKKMEIAKESLKKVKNYLNAFSVIPNERVFQIIDKETPLRQALSTVNKLLSQTLEGLIETIYDPGLINIDFADFRTISEGRGRLAYLNTVVQPKKKGQIQDFINDVLNSPLYPYGIRGAKGVLFNIAGQKDLSLADVNQISKAISELVNPEAKIIFGVSEGQKYSDAIKTTVLATGCGLKLFSSDRKKKTRKTAKKIIPKIKKEKKSKKAAPQIKIKPRPKKKRIKKFLKKIKIKITGNKKKRRLPKPQKKESPSPKPENKEVSSLPIGEETIRKNALQIRQEAEETEKEMMAREQFWETPAFLRKKFAKGQ